MPPMSRPLEAAGESSPNIALIKYWGKHDVLTNMPSSKSLSITLPKFKTTTLVSYSDENISPAGEDVFELNEKRTEIKDRMKLVIELFKTMAKDSNPILVRSTNNFAHGCGLASSASGYSALVKALNAFYNLNLDDKTLSIYARIGSGSASRSIYSGIVLFEGPGSVPVCDWPELRILCIVLDGKEKKVCSTEGMIRTMKTSNLYSERLKHVDENIEKIMGYIRAKDFESFAEIVMRASNEIHALCFDTYPPLRYISDVGFAIIEACHEVNKEGNKVAYTFDAGTNPFLITLDKHVDFIREIFCDYQVHECY